MAEFNLKSGNATPFKLMGSSPAKHPHTEKKAHGTYGHNTDTGKSVAEGGKAKPDNPNYVPPKKESPAKTHKKGHTLADSFTRTSYHEPGYPKKKKRKKKESV